MRRSRLLPMSALLLSLSLVAAACSDDGEETTTANATEESTEESTEPGATEEGTEPAADASVGLVYDLGGRGDQSFNDAAAAGLERAVSELGIEEPEELEPDEGGENREELLRLLADQGSNLIFGVGFLFEEAIGAVAPDFPDTTFAIVDSVVEEDNVASLTFAEQEGSFLVGAAAALKSETGQIGFIGGVETELIQKFEAGYVAGARQINPDVEVEVAYISQPPDFSGFNDPARGQEIARGQYDGGADVIYHAAGGSGGGLFQAAQEVSASTGTQHWAIGVDSDQYEAVDAELQPYILTSMLKKVDVAVFDTVSTFTEEGSASGATVFDLESTGVDYSTSGGFVDDITDQLEELKTQIIAGEIEVPTTPEG